MRLQTITIKCPLCHNQFDELEPISCYTAGQRLDLRLIGAVSSPWPVPLCPTCGLVIYKAEKPFTPREARIVAEVMATQTYKAIPQCEQAYHRMALIFEALKKPADVVAYTWLQASWEVEDKVRVNRQFLGKSLQWYERFLAKQPRSPKASSERSKNRLMTAQLLKGELLRRLKKFQAARDHFEPLLNIVEFKTHAFFGSIINQELKLIEMKNALPQEIQQAA
jgi:tetratricopeptide (TPR) repeat protein